MPCTKRKQQQQHLYIVTTSPTAVAQSPAGAMGIPDKSHTPLFLPVKTSGWKKGKTRQMLALRISLQQNNIPKHDEWWMNTEECLKSFQCLVISSFQQSPWGQDLTSDLLHGSERVTHDLYLELLTVVGHYIYFKVTVSRLFHRHFVPFSLTFIYSGKTFTSVNDTFVGELKVWAQHVAWWSYTSSQYVTMVCLYCRCKRNTVFFLLDVKKIEAIL